MPLARALTDRPGRSPRILLSIAAIAGLSAPVLAQTTEPPTMLHLSQTAEHEVERDLLRIELRVEETAADPLAVQTAINRRMAAALAQARQVRGVAAATGTYAVNDEQPPHGPSRWRGSQSLILLSKDADAALKLAGMLQSGGLLMSSMTYEVSPQTVHAAEQTLTAEALAGLGRRAASIAGNLHLSVLGYRDLRVGNAETGEPPTPRFAAMAMAMPAPVGAPGQAVVRVTVSADLQLGQPHR